MEESNVRAAGAAVALGVILLAGCSSPSDGGSSSGTENSGAPVSAQPLPADAAAEGAWIGNAGAQDILPSKRQVSNALGSQVTDGPDFATFTDADLNVSAQVEPSACAGVYQLVQALTVPADTTSMTSARYTVQGSEVVVAIGDSKASLPGLKSAIDACPSFRVVRRSGSEAGTIGDLVTDFTVRSAKMPDPDALDVKVDSNVQILMSTDATCSNTSSPAAGCFESRRERVSQSLRRSGPNLVSVWTMGTTEVDDMPSMEELLPIAAVRRLADAVAGGLPGAAKP